MRLAPGPHALHMDWVPVVVAVLRLAQPTLLAGPFAGDSAGGLVTVALMVTIAVVGLV